MAMSEDDLISEIIRLAGLLCDEVRGCYQEDAFGVFEHRVELEKALKLQAERNEQT